MRILTLILMSHSLVGMAFAASLSLGTWNVANNPTTAIDDGFFGTIISEMGGFSILGLNETNTDSSLRFRNLVHSTLGVSSYDYEISSAAGGDRVGVIYDTSQVTLISSTEITSPSLTRPIYRGLFSPVGTASTLDDFYFYSAHFKSGSTGADATQRGIEAGILRNDIAGLGSSNYVLSGDLNVLGASETAWTSLLAGGLGQLFDPVNASGEWRDNAAYLSLHTQDPSSAMDDRFDFVLASSSFFTGSPYDYINGSYQTIGNDGTHTLNGAITTGSGDSTLLTALANASDHLPVFASFNIGIIATPEPSSTLLILFSGLVIRFLRSVLREQPSVEYEPVVRPRIQDPLTIYE